MSQDETHNTAQDMPDIGPQPTSATPSAIPANLFLLDPTNRDFIDHNPQPFRLFTRARVILLVVLLTMLVPILILAEGMGSLSGAMQLEQSSLTAHGQITNRRSALIAGGRGQATNYFLAYRYYATDLNVAFTNEQLVNKDTYDHLSEGTPVDVKYAAANPRISTLSGSNSDNAHQNNGSLMMALGLIGTLITGAWGGRQLLHLQEAIRLKRSGQLVIGHINRCTGKLKVTRRSLDTEDYGGPLRGNFFIDVYYRFRTPANNEIRQHAIRKRNDLLSIALPSPDTPVAVLYLDDQHYEIL